MEDVELTLDHCIEAGQLDVEQRFGPEVIPDLSQIIDACRQQVTGTGVLWPEDDRWLPIEIAIESVILGDGIAADGGTIEVREHWAPLADLEEPIGVNPELLSGARCLLGPLRELNGWYEERAVCHLGDEGVYCHLLLLIAADERLEPEEFLARVVEAAEIDAARATETSEEAP